MDSLLGIGTDGGTSKGEGKALASRLTQMRKERNERAVKSATPAKKKEMTSPLSPPAAFGGGPAGEMTLQGLDDIGGEMGEMEIVTPGGGGGTSKKKSNNNKKKKKKRKKKK